MKGKISKIPLKMHMKTEFLRVPYGDLIEPTRSSLLYPQACARQKYGNQGTYINIIVLLNCDLQCIRQTTPQETSTETGVLWNKKRSYPQLDREFPISCRTQQVIIEGRLSTRQKTYMHSLVSYKEYNSDLSYIPNLHQWSTCLIVQDLTPTLRRWPASLLTN